MGQILVWESFFVELMSVPNFMKIQEGQIFFCWFGTEWPIANIGGVMNERNAVSKFLGLLLKPYISYMLIFHGNQLWHSSCALP